MTLDDLHQVAQATTPSSVDVPKTWPAIIVWAIGKFGIGIIGFGFLVPVYLDLKDSNMRFAKIAEASASAMQALAIQVENQNKEISRIDEAVRRLEASNK